MAVTLNPYLQFNGNAREAMEYYHSVFGGSLNLSTFGESGMEHAPDDADKVLHAQLDGDNGVTLMGSDTANGMQYTPAAGISISLSGDDDATLRGYWEKLSDGGTPFMPLEVAPWGDAFGMLADRYGIQWMVNISGAAAGA